ncbi:MAG: hypothetical protein F6K65_31060 [Moorea sp. SIO3C2]|nr:hypothetical protein [Moorena sp. SIO3C2]
MNVKLITKIVTVGAIALSSLGLNVKSSQAQNTNFFCGMSQGIPTTIASTARGNVPIIRWVSGYFSRSGYTPQVRCQEVSSRFQSYYNQGILSYITTGIMNNQPVVCVTSSNGGPCAGLLFTLKRRQNASRTLQQLFDIRQGASGPLYESTGGSRKFSIDVEKFLKTAPVEEGTQPNHSPEPEPNNNNNPAPGGSVW